MLKTNPLEFMQHVRQEATKVTWPTRRETMITTTMVMIMVAMAGYYLMYEGLHTLSHLSDERHPYLKHIPLINTVRLLPTSDGSMCS